jgi:hypothetical protein
MRAVYVSSAPADAATAATLGIPFELEPATVSPFALVQGTIAFTIPAPVSPAQLAADIASVQAADATAAAAAATLATNQATITANAAAHPPAFITYLAVAVPTVAQTTAQLNALTKAVNALVYLATEQYGTTNGT